MGIFKGFKNLVGRVKGKLFKGGQPVTPPPSTTEEREPGSAEEWLYSGNFLFVGSSNVSEVAYDRDNQRLYVLFINDKRKPGKSNFGYYENITPDVAKAFYQSDSPGRFIWRLRAQGVSWLYLTALHTPGLKGPQVIRQFGPAE